MPSAKILVPDLAHIAACYVGLLAEIPGKSTKQGARQVRPYHAKRVPPTFSIARSTMSV